MTVNAAASVVNLSVEEIAFAAAGLGSPVLAVLDLGQRSNRGGDARALLTQGEESLRARALLTRQRNGRWSIAPLVAAVALICAAPERHWAYDTPGPRGARRLWVAGRQGMWVQLMGLGPELQCTLTIEIEGLRARVGQWLGLAPQPAAAQPTGGPSRLEPIEQGSWVDADGTREPTLAGEALNVTWLSGTPQRSMRARWAVDRGGNWYSAGASPGLLAWRLLEREQLLQALTGFSEAREFDDVWRTSTRDSSPGSIGLGGAGSPLCQHTR